ncbi:MAG: peptidase M23 [Betaproteobacteria bacterium RIFCSPLOWO2_12_FULL_64_23]|nr:MAG: peptidase M23 [Betaproteobacteria bacterium RIFCSPLOWO2_12_FULL_64_23]
MHIILVSNRLATAKSISLGTRHLLLGTALLTAIVVGLSSSMFYLVFRHAVEIKLPLVQQLLLSAQEQQTENAKEFMRENLNAMAVRLGQMQAQLMRLDALGERLSALAGIKPQEFRMSEPPGRGGALPTSIPAQDLSMNELTGQLDALSRHMENRYDYMGILENRLFDARVKKKLMPTVRPVDVDWNASSFGWRIDPITGQNALHEGIDFLVDTGTPVHAAAGGLVVVAQFHPQYGHMIDIDHGNDFTTRYAHNSKLLLKPGDLVQRGAIIAESGSTGRSTGPHVHFEVRYKGVAQNPNRFLQVSAATIKAR